MAGGTGSLWEGGDRHETRSRLRPALQPKVEAWNRTFTIPFHLFRHRVREIAQRNHERVEGAVLAAWEDIPLGSLVLPVDDDDWFAPDVAQVLEAENDSAVTGYYWTSTFIQVPIHLRHRLGLIRRRFDPTAKPKYTCTTNNYAMVKTAETEPLLAWHVEASGWVDSHRDRIHRIERRLSLMNRTLASQTSLAHEKPTIAWRRLLWRYYRYKRLYREPTLPDLEWSRPYVAMMRELMEVLELRSRHW